MAEQVTVVYDGSHAAVDIHDSADGSLIAQDVAQGQSVDVPKHVGESLVESGNFKPVKKPEPQAQKEGK